MFVKVLCLALVAVCIVAQSHNVEWGKREFNDSMVLRQFMKKSSKLLQVVTDDLDYPNKTQPHNPNRTITYIRVLDQKSDGSGGYATLNYGGVGFSNAGLHLKSQRNKGFDFIVEIYSR